MNVYQKPKLVTNIKDCYFYHTVDLPGHETIYGEWDFRNNARRYLGKVHLKNKRVLELGTASGFFSFYMESKGAKVVSYDLSPKYSWDIVPYANRDNRKYIKVRKKHIGKLNNSYWYSHRLLNSKNKMVYGEVYNIPKGIGKFDITTFGCILLHLRDPFLALEKASTLTKETLVITDLIPQESILDPKMPVVYFHPKLNTEDPSETWWLIPPKTLVHFVKILGFTKTKISHHTQKFMNTKFKMYTLVAKRN